MYQANFGMQELFESGAHFGHRKNLWNPKMSQYIYGIRNGVHIIDLRQTYIMLNAAMGALKSVAANNGKILFVGTKKQATDLISEQAQRCGQHYVNYRWPGGMLTNWPTVSKSLKTLQGYEKQLANTESGLTKKELLYIDKKRQKLEQVLGGIRNMNGLPDVMFVVDTNEQKIAIQEANRLRIPVIAIVDTNASLDGVSYVIPGNDDSSKALSLYTKLAADAIIAGTEERMLSAGVDVTNANVGAAKSVVHDAEVNKESIELRV
jgi:small subunit ribosomal protein S2